MKLKQFSSENLLENSTQRPLTAVSLNRVREFLHLHRRKPLIPQPRILILSAEWTSDSPTHDFVALPTWG